MGDTTGDTTGETMMAWRVVRHGRPSEALRLDECPMPVPGPGELLVEVATTALNYNEVDGCHGRYRTIDPPLPYTLGMEMLGTVTAAGPGPSDAAWIGRRVVATAVGATGAHAQYALASADMTFAAPEMLDDVEGGAFLFPFHLAHLGLFERAATQPGETVLVHAAAGGVGSAAIQLGAATGARVIAVAGGSAKVERCRQLGADVVVDHRERSFVDVVLEATGGRGVDVVFDGVGGAVTVDSLRCLGRGGRHVIVGFAGGIEAEDLPGVLPRSLCFGNFSTGGVLLAYRSDPVGGLAAAGINVWPRSVGDAVHGTLLGLLGQGRIGPVVGRVAPSRELPAALDEMETRTTIGRTIITWKS